MSNEDFHDSTVPSFRIPHDHNLWLTHLVSQPSKFTKRLRSERGRHIFDETFVKDSRLGALSDLCVEALAKAPHIPYVPTDPLKIRVYYDKLDVELPLSDCWQVSNERYWRRVVLEKNEDKLEAMNSARSWRNEGTSRKFVEIMEKCPAEYWPNEEMKELAIKIKGFVKEMYIRRLQSLQERALDELFEIYLNPEGQLDTPSEMSLQEEVEPPTKPKKKKIRSLFELELEGEELEVPVPLKVDKRDLVEYAKKKKQDRCPFEICHHIDLSFIQHFTELTIFSIEFLGPIQGAKYEIKHFRFSYDDVRRLATGLQYLEHLRVFRFCNSYMDATKLDIVLGELMFRTKLEEVDFSNDHFIDDCGECFENFLLNMTSLRRLILEGNYFGENTMNGLANGINRYRGELEYLSLKNNPMNDEAVEALINGIIGTDQVRILFLTGTRMTEAGVISSIAQELLSNHPILDSLEFRAMPLSKAAVTEILIALRGNKKIQHFDIRGCDLDLIDERDIKILIKRNQYIALNPYLEEQQTEEEIEAFVSRIKNPVMLNALDNLQKYCTPDIAIPEYVWTDEKDDKGDSEDDVESNDSIIKSKTHEEIDEEPVQISFEFNSIKEIYDHTAIPGPAERYFYFRNLKKTH